MIVETPGGRVEGAAVEHGGRTLWRFGGVPYAAAPVGERRFAPPEPVVPWRGVRDATERGAGPPQAFREDGAVPDMFPVHTAEDCLTAEIFTRDLDGAAPVLVWVPGGRYQIGAAGLATYDGSALAAAHGIVVVGLNYRLGATGFAAVDGVFNNGLRDVLFALRWIRDHIDAFGGDGSKITIMGESAGAGCVAHVLASPHLDVDLTGAVIQSASPGSTMTVEKAATVLESLLDHAGVEEAGALRGLPIDALVAAQERAAIALMGSVGMMPFHPVLDGDVVPANPLVAATSGSWPGVPLIVGTTANEMELFRSAVPDLPADVANRFISRKLAPFVANPSETADALIKARDGDLVEVVADAELHLPARVLADAAVAAGAPAWRYVFAWESPDRGAFHALDLPFTFGTLDVANWREVAGAYSVEADRLSSTIGEAIAALTHGRRPAGWVDHDPTSPQLTRLGATIDIITDEDRTCA